MVVTSSLSSRSRVATTASSDRFLRYMSWVDQNMESPNPARGIIVANEITEDLKPAAGRVPDIRLIEYKISFKLNPI
jgi:endonuclease